jgi:hypothetical protein
MFSPWEFSRPATAGLVSLVAEVLPENGLSDPPFKNICKKRLYSADDGIILFR